MKNWKKYWTESPSTVGKNEFLRQVGHTINGQAYTAEQFEDMVAGICKRLEINEDDCVLDLCCGNGIITRQLAGRCREVVGIDFSEPLLEIANQYHSAPNLSYVYLNALELDRLLPVRAGQFSKILMYGALQHFQRSNLQLLLSKMLPLATEHVIILFGGVPDQARKNNFYPSTKQKLRYLYYKLSGRDRIGTWWSEPFIRKTCKDLQLECWFEHQSGDRPGASYRFDIVIRKIPVD